MKLGILHYILLIVAILLILLILLQESKSDGASGAVTGGGLNLFSKTKDRGLAKILVQTTGYLIAIFIFLIFILKMS